MVYIVVTDAAPPHTLLLYQTQITHKSSPPPLVPRVPIAGSAVDHLHSIFWSGVVTVQCKECSMVGLFQSGVIHRMVNTPVFLWHQYLLLLPFILEQSQAITSCAVLCFSNTKSWSPICWEIQVMTLCKSERGKGGAHHTAPITNICFN